MNDTKTKENTLKLFERKGHKRERRELHKNLRNARSPQMWIYDVCERCNISIYLWSQNGMPPCHKNQ